MDSYLTPKPTNQVNKIASSCEICSGLHDTQYCMENPEQALVEYASLHTDKAGGKWYTFKPDKTTLVIPIIRHGKVTPTLDARLTKFEADFRQQQSEMINKVNVILKAMTDRITGTLPSDTVKNPKLNVSSARSYPTMDPQCSTPVYGSIKDITLCPKQLSEPQEDESDNNEQEEGNISENINVPSHPPLDVSVKFITEKVCRLNSFLEAFGVVPRSSNVEYVCTKNDDGDVMFIEIVKKNDDSEREEFEGERSEMAGDWK
ncbi:hypothetical protein Tco_0375701 [Tanacetum coccineum]